MFNVAARIFKTTYVANIIFEPDSTGLENFSLCHRIFPIYDRNQPSIITAKV